MMKKYIVLTVLTLTLTGGLLTGCGSEKDIGQDAAKEAAFADAQVFRGGRQQTSGHQGPG